MFQASFARVVPFCTAQTHLSEVTYLSMTDRAEFSRLTLQLERDLVAQAHIREILTAADTTVADRRREMRNLRARMARQSPEPGRTT
jgi:hypothetical protein